MPASPVLVQVTRTSLQWSFFLLSVWFMTLRSSLGVRVLSMSDTTSMKCDLQGDQHTIDCHMTLQRHKQTRLLKYCLDGDFCLQAHLTAEERESSSSRRLRRSGSGSFTVGKETYGQPFDLNYRPEVISVLYKRERYSEWPHDSRPSCSLEAVAWLRELGNAHRSAVTVMQRQHEALRITHDKEAMAAVRKEVERSANAFQEAIAVCEAEKNDNARDPSPPPLGAAVIQRRQQIADIYLEMAESYLLSPSDEEHNGYNHHGQAREAMNRAEQVYRNLIHSNEAILDKTKLEELEVAWADSSIRLGRDFLSSSGLFNEDTGYEVSGKPTWASNTLEEAILVGVEQQQQAQGVDASSEADATLMGGNTSDIYVLHDARKAELYFLNAVNVYSKLIAAFDQRKAQIALEGGAGAEEATRQEKERLLPLQHHYAMALTYVGKAAQIQGELRKATEYGEMALTVYKKILPQLPTGSFEAADTKMMMAELFYRLAETYLRMGCQQQMGKSFVDFIPVK